MFILFWLTASMRRGSIGHLTLCLHWWGRGGEGREKRRGERRLTGFTPGHLVTYIVWGAKYPTQAFGEIIPSIVSAHGVSLLLGFLYFGGGGDWTSERICSLFTSDPLSIRTHIWVGSDVVIAVFKCPTVGHGEGWGQSGGSLV